MLRLKRLTFYNFRTPRTRYADTRPSVHVMLHVSAYARTRGTALVSLTDRRRLLLPLADSEPKRAYRGANDKSLGGTIVAVGKSPTFIDL